MIKKKEKEKKYQKEGSNEVKEERKGKEMKGNERKEGRK